MPTRPERVLRPLRGAPHKRGATDDLAGSFGWHAVTDAQWAGPPIPPAPSPPPPLPPPLNVSVVAYATLAAAAGTYNQTHPAHATHTLGEKMYQEAIDRLEVQLEVARELPSWAIALITTSSICLGGVVLWCIALCVLAPCVWGWRRFDRDEPPPSADVELAGADDPPELEPTDTTPTAPTRKVRFDDMDD